MLCLDFDKFLMWISGKIRGYKASLSKTFRFLQKDEDGSRQSGALYFIRTYLVVS